MILEELKNLLLDKLRSESEVTRLICNWESKEAYIFFQCSDRNGDEELCVLKFMELQKLIAKNVYDNYPFLIPETGILYEKKAIASPAVFKRFIFFGGGDQVLDITARKVELLKGI